MPCRATATVMPGDCAVHAGSHIVPLPGLSEGDDIEQWIAGRRALGIAKTAILAELRLLVSACA
jgi:hypothetical protein